MQKAPPSLREGERHRPHPRIDTLDDAWASINLHQAEGPARPLNDGNGDASL
eukprot:CAMPEP_0117580802 /NCGR_PEP_ID=MMETSP0784-20121206/65429_1 /TAXON_ID=39447 /ORGANISM="" /LENGTH=51 /DNA_ID=CAMNT_0005380953 /DNA_START=74 /DNA_END=226 /DNA_ORIENTATION=+